MPILWPRGVVRSPAASASNVIQPTDAAVSPLTIKGASAQSADLLRCVNSSDTPLFRVAADGGLDFINGASGVGSSGQISLNSTSAGYITGVELSSAPAAPAANSWRLYAIDNGAGKTQLFVRFATGVAQLLATEP